MTKAEEFFHRYSHLADYYAKKIHHAGSIGMDQDDIKQELRLKLFLAIKTYAKKWGAYKKSGNMKPMPIEFYLKTVMLNQVRDFIKEINKVHYVSIDDIQHVHAGHERMEFSKTDVKVGFQSLSDLFENKRQKKLMKLFFLFGFDINNVLKFGKGTNKTEKHKYAREAVNNGLLRIREFLEQN